MSAPLELEGVWKAYPRWPGGGRTVRAIVGRRVPLLLRGGEQDWALRDVSLTVAPGECVGVIGPNGAGKSTLLRLAAGLGRPTRGAVAARGRLSAVLSLGATLDLTLTGRENALTAALVAGLRRREARALVPAALAFAELEEVADAPVRTYSEGMKLRLAFGVVAQLEPDVLLLDEVIAVGDLAFQSRCLARMRELRERGTAVLLASHDLGQVAAECDGALWLHDGEVRAAGSAGDVTARYEESARERALAATPPPSPGEDGPLRLRANRVGTQALTVEEVAVQDAGGRAVAELVPGVPGRIAVGLAAHRAGIVDPIVAVAVHRVADGVLCWEASTHAAGARLGPVTGSLVAALDLERVDLVPGEYVLDVGVYSPDWQEVYDYHWHAHPLRVAGAGSGKGVVRPQVRWSIGPESGRRGPGPPLVD